MAGWEDAVWPANPTAATKVARLGGRYRTYWPDALVERPLVLPDDVDDLAARVEASVRSLGERPGVQGLEGLARFLLRSEAIASSRIEGLHVSPQQVGLAEVADEESLTQANVSRTARRVAANIAALRQATHGLARSERVSVDAIVDLQSRLLADDSRFHGFRDVQNWIGGADGSPIGAEFVPPLPSRVQPLMADLVTYLNSGGHAPLIQAALVHAQFETIHPFKDGNGRVGRALIHTVLVRRGLTRSAVLPISPVLLTRSHEYVQGLTSYRYEGGAADPTAIVAVSTWIRVFLDAVSVAVIQAEAFAADLVELRTGWKDAVARHRRDHDLREVPRTDSATARILDTLQEYPVLTTASVARLFHVSERAASTALDELAGAGVVEKRRLDGRTSAYLAMDVFELIGSAERQLASTRWDTGVAPPSRVVPAQPGG